VITYKSTCFYIGLTIIFVLINWCILYFVALATKVYFLVNMHIYIYRLFNYGIGIHLLESDKVAAKRGEINPKENHISFQSSDMKLIMKNLDAMKIEYVTAVVEDGGIQVDQLFFHDPDGYMIEICNCQNLPVLPISTCPLNNVTNQAPPFYGMFSSNLLQFFLLFPIK
jgi:hypothetical protein